MWKSLADKAFAAQNKLSELTQDVLADIDGETTDDTDQDSDEDLLHPLANNTQPNVPSIATTPQQQEQEETQEVHPKPVINGLSDDNMILSNEVKHKVQAPEQQQQPIAEAAGAIVVQTEQPINQLPSIKQQPEEPPADDVENKTLAVTPTASVLTPPEPPPPPQQQQQERQEQHILLLQQQREQHEQEMQELRRQLETQTQQHQHEMQLLQQQQVQQQQQQQNQHQREMKQMRERYGSLLNQLKTLQGECRDAIQRESRAQHEAALAVDKLQAAVLDNASLKDQLDDVLSRQASQDDASQRLEATQDELAELHVECAQLRENYTHVSSRVEELEGDAEALQSERTALTALRKEHDALVSANAVLEKEFATNKTALHDLEGVLVQIQDENANLGEKLAQHALNAADDRRVVQLTQGALSDAKQQLARQELVLERNRTYIAKLEEEHRAHIAQAEAKAAAEMSLRDDDHAEQPIDRRLVVKMLVEFFTKQQDTQVLELMMRVCEFSEDQQNIVRQAVAKRRSNKKQSSGSADSSSSSSVPDKSKSGGLADLWVEYLLQESSVLGQDT